LVFVHGLRGDPIESWKAGNTVWLRDLLPQSLPNIRIMTYGYDADVINFFSNTSKSSIFQHSINLLEDLQLERDTPEEKRRPIIFVGHSLGGLVVKDALSKSNEYRSNNRNPRAASILTSTTGVVFLGTPHRGGNQVDWAKIATGLATVVYKDNNKRIVDALSRGSEVLERLQDSFSSIVGQLDICSFFEDHAYGVTGSKIVDDDSASLGCANERKWWIPANHSEMCKFKDRKETGYRRVAGALKNLVEDAGKKEGMNAPQENGMTERVSFSITGCPSCNDHLY
ncbi:hypothetical protein N431DRAFT_355121, partial [Stipitochalara longipes BDJ]